MADLEQNLYRYQKEESTFDIEKEAHEQIKKKMKEEQK